MRHQRVDEDPVVDNTRKKESSISERSISYLNIRRIKRVNSTEEEIEY